MSTSSRTIKWIENLAEQENLIKAGEKASIDICSTKDEVLGVETTTFIQDLFHHFEYLVSLFNGRVSGSNLELRLLRTDRPVNFSLQRNQLRLNVSTPQLGVIQLQCDKLIADPSSRTPKSSMMFSGRVEARYGTFHDVEWYFLGNRVNAELLARHYLTEFIQVSRSTIEN